MTFRRSGKPSFVPFEKRKKEKRKFIFSFAAIILAKH